MLVTAPPLATVTQYEVPSGLWNVMPLPAVVIFTLPPEMPNVFAAIGGFPYQSNAIAVEYAPLAFELRPNAIAFAPLATAVLPIAIE